MSFGHVMSRKLRSRTIHYRIGDSPAPERWHKKRIGWFGHAVLISVVSVFGLFSLEAKQMILQAAGAQMSSLNPADFQKPEQIAPLTSKVPAAATNIIDAQSLISSWAKSHGPMQWGVVIRSLDGPQIDTSLSANNSFESRAMYKVFLATALYDQFPAEKQHGSVKIGRSSASITSCIEKMFKTDDHDCTVALGTLLNQQAATDFFKKSNINKTVLSVSTQTAKTTPADTATLYTGLNGSVISIKSTATLLKLLAAQPQNQQLTVACPGCTTAGAADYGVGRLEAAGIVKYSKGSYLYVVYANGGTNDLTLRLSGKLQQKIVETTTDAFKP